MLKGILWRFRLIFHCMQHLHAFTFFEVVNSSFTVQCWGPHWGLLCNFVKNIQEQHSASGNLGIFSPATTSATFVMKNMRWCWYAIVHSHHTCSMLAPLFFDGRLALLCSAILANRLLDWQPAICKSDELVSEKQKRHLLSVLETRGVLSVRPNAFIKASMQHRELLGRCHARR